MLHNPALDNYLILEVNTLLRGLGLSTVVWDKRPCSLHAVCAVDSGIDLVWRTMFCTDFTLVGVEFFAREGEKFILTKRCSLHMLLASWASPRGKACGLKTFCLSVTLQILCLQGILENFHSTTNSDRPSVRVVSGERVLSPISLQWRHHMPPPLEVQEGSLRVCPLNPYLLHPWRVTQW